MLRFIIIFIIPCLFIFRPCCFSLIQRARFFRKLSITEGFLGLRKASNPIALSRWASPLLNKRRSVYFEIFLDWLFPNSFMCYNCLDHVTLFSSIQLPLIHIRFMGISPFWIVNPRIVSLWGKFGFVFICFDLIPVSKICVLFVFYYWAVGIWEFWWWVGFVVIRVLFYLVFC